MEFLQLFLTGLRELIAAFWTGLLGLLGLGG